MAGVKAEEFRGRGVEMLYAADDILDMREEMEGGKHDQKHDRGLGRHEGDREKKNGSVACSSVAGRSRYSPIE